MGNNDTSERRRIVMRTLVIRYDEGVLRSTYCVEEKDVVQPKNTVSKSYQAIPKTANGSANDLLLAAALLSMISNRTFDSIRNSLQEIYDSVE